MCHCEDRPCCGHLAEERATDYYHEPFDSYYDDDYWHEDAEDWDEEDEEEDEEKL